MPHPLEQPLSGGFFIDEKGKHSAADVVAKAQAVLSEPELLRAMFDVGYFPPNTPPDNIKVGLSLRVLHENT